MKLTPSRFLKGASWTFGGYFLSLVFRFATNVILTRLLAPEVFGAMVIINTIKLGIDLTCDVGLNQNIIYSKNGAKPDYYNTAWTLQVLRGILLFILCLAFAAPVAEFYNIPVVAMQLTALSFLLLGAASLSRALAVKNMNLVVRNIFDTTIDFFTLVMIVSLTYYSPTILSLVIGNLLGLTLMCVASFWLPAPKHKLMLSPKHTWEILSFGKWIFLTSILFFASSNADRMFLGKAAPLAMLGIYGIARSLAELPAHLVARLSDFIVLPIVSGAEGTRSELREQVSRLRFLSLIGAAVALSLAAIAGDVVIKVIYDDRYVQAAWMLPLLLLGVWGAVLCEINEATLVGFGCPYYSTLANTVKLVWLVVTLPLAYQAYGILGAIIAVAAGDIIRYMPMLFGQVRERFSFARQDFATTVLLFGLFGLWFLLRDYLGLGSPFDTYAASGD